MVERQALLAQLMAQPAACPLPCWWGIELETRLDDVGRRFAELGLSGWTIAAPDIRDPGQMGSIRLGYFDPATSVYDVDVLMRFRAVEEEVTYIEVIASRPLTDAGWTEFKRDWEPYYLDALIEKLRAGDRRSHCLILPRAWHCAPVHLCRLGRNPDAGGVLLRLEPG
jgi:hypothetical protein